MGLERWQPPTALTRQEQFLMKRLTRTRKLFGFLRTWRHALFGVLLGRLAGGRGSRPCR